MLIDGSPRLVKAGLKLGNSRVCQSIAGNSKTLYTCQVSVGAERAGHLLVTRIDRATWARTGLMRIRGAGHGVAIGYDGWLWAECGPITRVDGSARGSRITRCKFVDGKRLGHGALVLDPPGSRCTPSVDLAERQLAVRAWENGRYGWRLYSLDGALEGKLTQLSGPHWVEPAGLMQGWCLHAGHIYAVLGENGQTVTLADIDLVAGTRPRYHDTGLRVAGYSEPEGIAVIDGQLWFGIATGRAGARRLNLYRMEN